MTELVVLTHNDLDAMGCYLNIEYKMPNIMKKYFYTNYGNLDKIIGDLESYVIKNGVKHILIADVSFGDNKDALRRLYQLGKCTHIDHHVYPDGFWDEFPEMKVEYDSGKCAAKLCNDFFGNTGKNPGLDKLTYLIDVYDIWQVKNPHFKIAQGLNNYFWTQDLETFGKQIAIDNYKLPGDYLSVISEIDKKTQAGIKDYEDRNLIHRFGKITVAFVQDFFNEILIREMENGQDVVIGVSSFGIIRIRISEDAKFSLEQKQRMMLGITGAVTIGHMNAFTYKFSGPKGVDNLMEEVQRVINLIVVVMNEN